jgi:1,4-dihydroxy-2-naphthoate octaprenyltransferase
VKTKAWFTALRAHFLTATLAPVLVGTAAAWYTSGSFSWSSFVLALVGCALVHLGANMSNDYFDYRSETDVINKGGSAYSGGSRVIQDGLIPARQILVAAIVCLSLGALIGIWLVISLRSIPLLIIGIVGMFCAWFYTGAPLRLGYKGFAELLNGISFGPVIALGAYAVQAPLWSTPAFFASIPPGVLLAALLMINEFPDHDADTEAGKRTFVVRLGKRKASVVYHVTVFFPFLWVPVLVIAGVFPIWTLLSLLSLPLALRAAAVLRAHVRQNTELLPANKATFLLHLGFNLLLALGLLIG